MSWLERYRPPLLPLWQPAVSRPEQIYHDVKAIDLSKDSTFAGKRAVLGFVSDEGVRRNHGRPGAKEGPSSIRKCLGRLILNSVAELADFGDIVCEDGDLESAQEALGQAVETIHAHPSKPFLLVLGGGHEVAYGHYLGLRKKYKRLAIINLDAHLDFRQSDASHSGTSFLQIAKLCETESRYYSYTCIGLQELATDSMQKKSALHYRSQLIAAQEIAKAQLSLETILKESDSVYLSICMDVFQESIVPGVSAPQSLGLFPFHVLPIIQQIKASGKLVACDIAELAPNLDIDNKSAKLAASLAAIILG